ncbi:MAG: hypothetical protein QXH27_00420 [Candidatus Micrarchaeia archaeon]
MRGFFFTLLIAVALAFMLVSLALWGAVVRAREEKVPAKFQLEAMLSIADASSEAETARLVSLLGYRALRALVLDVIATGSVAQQKKAGEELCSVLINGTRLSGKRIFNESLSAWGEAMANASRALGFEWKLAVRPDKCSAKQVAPWDINLDITDIRIEISSEEMNLSKIVTVSARIPIVGLEDPLISVKDAELRGVPYSEANIRQVFRSPFSIEEVRPKNTANGTRGKSWVYGVTTDDSFNDAYKNDRYILVIEDTGICANGDCSQLNSYGGVLLLAPGPGHQRTGATATRTCGGAGCTNTCIFAEVRETEPCLDCLSYYELESETNASCCTCSTPSGGVEFNEVEVPFLHTNALTKAKLNITPTSPVGLPVLINSPFSNNGDYSREARKPEVWDIERLRDLVVCGHYINVTGAHAPNFLSRLEGRANANDQFGIESFVIGMWATEERSKVDHVYYTSSAAGRPVKGMPGCKNRDMCTSASTIGRFAIDAQHATSNYYNISSSLLCPPSPAEC